MCFQLQEYLTPGVVLKFRPYRNVFIGISSVAIFFAILIIVENIIFLSIVSKQSIPLLLIPYILSWVLFFLGFCFARFAYLIHSGRKSCASVIPLSSPIAWEDSRPVSPVPPSPIVDVTMVIPPMIYRNSLTVPTSPFFITDNGISTYRDEPPSYNEIVERGVSPIPAQPAKVALPDV
ncbi:uncharacterized protein CELE_ZC84.7 [Caenorhabditis elegans]|uniref:Uncharacterized protein n=1 Tax=Caenorhabditis elegans TaxID=6239 RepID=Q7YWM4_CAEEL|nr:Uncharacterized protein CELE_ZC84.7 [Caenorhabditis elegans]CAE18055.3 Uncharacterized protein CELE_ZC84.7 [Caenorhabditis elegans]|eukprot:NP_001022979.3 Uncharacterized protein CELE_ZC84.7 [Caenorhabditis elegans]